MSFVVQKVTDRWLAVRRLQQLTLCFLLSIAFAQIKPNTGSCDDVTLVSRKEWRSRPYAPRRAMPTPVNAVIIIHTVSLFCSNNVSCIRNVQFIQNYHMDDRGYSTIGYNFLIGGDGRAYEGRGWNERGAHSVNFNTNSIGIAFMGNFNQIAPSKIMLDGALNLIDCGVNLGYLTPTREIYGHRDVSCTESPGQVLYDIIKTWNNFKGGLIKGYNCER